MAFLRMQSGTGKYIIGSPAEEEPPSRRPKTGVNDAAGNHIYPAGCTINLTYFQHHNVRSHQHHRCTP
ncbi:g5993 [Coccomyxa elongata]